MSETHDILRFHGRRWVDELVGALGAGNVSAAMAHKKLSLLHFERFVSIVVTTTGGTDPDLRPPIAANEDQGITSASLIPDPNT